MSPILSQKTVINPVIVTVIDPITMTVINPVTMNAPCSEKRMLNASANKERPRAAFEVCADCPAPKHCPNSQLSVCSRTSLLMIKSVKTRGITTDDKYPPP